MTGEKTIDQRNIGETPREKYREKPQTYRKQVYKIVFSANGTNETKTYKRTYQHLSSSVYTNDGEMVRPVPFLRA